MTTVFEGQMLIDGELVESVSGERFDSINPVNEELIGTVPRANADDVEHIKPRGELRRSGLRPIWVTELK